MDDEDLDRGAKLIAQLRDELSVVTGKTSLPAIFVGGSYIGSDEEASDRTSKG